MYRLAVLCGIGCFAFLLGCSLLLRSVLPEWVGQVAWLVLITALSAVCAYREPKLGWGAGAVVVGVQPPCLLLVVLLSGEASHPSSSTGGLAGVFIASVLMGFVSPLPMLSAGLAARVRRRHDAQIHSPTGAAR